MKAEILKMLRESGDYVSGQQLCEQFGVSRTAVWKVISQLKEEGYEIEAVRNKGYRILNTPDVMTEQELKSLLAGQTKWAGQNIHYYKETDSTNLRAKQCGDADEPQGTLVVAEMQSAGRGRRGRSWESPSGENIYMTLLLRPDIEPSKAPMLTLVMAYSVAVGIRNITGLDVQIKWPNDIVCGGKKLVGILTEMSTEIEYINHVIIGVGINVNLCEFPEEIRETASSLRLELGHTVRRAPLIAEILKVFENCYEQFLQKQDLTDIQEAYNELLVNRGREVRICGAKDSCRAQAVGIDEQGQLIVCKEDGTREAVYAGEVSVRGVYGYV